MVSVENVLYMSKNALLNKYETCVSTAQQPLFGQGLLIIEASVSYSDTQHLIGLLWTSDRAFAKTFTWQNTSHNRLISMLPSAFQPTIAVGKLQQAHA
jgi:hypothetical protein